MKKFFYDSTFDVGDVTAKLIKIMSKWSVHILDINGPNWLIYDYDGEIRYFFQFQVDFNDLQTRIKLEDLKLNIIHFIESLKDDTDYIDNLTNPVFIK